MMNDETERIKRIMEFLKRIDALLDRPYRRSCNLKMLNWYGTGFSRN